MKMRWITAAKERVNRLLILLAVLFLVVGVLVVLLNVASRYVLHLSLPWSADVARYAIVWSALLAAVVLANRHEHLKIDLLGSRLRGGGKRLLDIVVAIGSMTFFLIVAISGALLVWRTWGQVVPSIAFLPMPIVYAIMPLAGLLMWLGACVDLFRIVNDEEDSA